MIIANVAVANVGCKPNWTKLCHWLKRRRPEIATLQKIGSTEPFPTEVLCKIGYESWCLDHNQNYLGVAILVQHDFLNRRDVPPKVRDRELPCDETHESRFLTVSLGDLWVSSVYAPYGPKWKTLGKQGAIKRRVAWLNRLRGHVCREDHDRWVLCGDFNVKTDGPPWGTGYYSQEEKDALEELKNVGFCDLYRKAHPDKERMPGYTRGCGQRCPSRLHLIVAGESVKECLRTACVEPESSLYPREDAPPLVVELDDV